jgi:hypothetical protein
MSQDSIIRMTVMTISAFGFSASTFTAHSNAAVPSVVGQEDAQDAEVTARAVRENDSASGDISDNLSVSAKQLLKRLAELQAQLRDLRAKMQAAENATYSNPAAKNSVVASFQSQISAVTGAILLMSAALLKELDRSGGLNITV